MFWPRFSRTINKTPLGRWNLIRCERALERRVALANTDHCGPCSYEELDFANAKEKFILIDKNGECKYVEKS